MAPVDKRAESRADAHARMRADMPPAKRALCVSIHDVAPANWSDCLRLLDAVREVADIPLTWLVVPRFHDSAAQSGPCEAMLSDLQTQGHELALHGYTHLDPAPSGLSLRDYLVRRVYTQREGEFAAISAAEARCRIELGLRWFNERGWSPAGFVAPAWLMGSEAWRALADFPFAYTTTYRHFHLLQGLQGGGPAGAAAAQDVHATALPDLPQRTLPHVSPHGSTLPHLPGLSALIHPAHLPDLSGVLHSHDLPGLLQPAHSHDFPGELHPAHLPDLSGVLHSAHPPDISGVLHPAPLYDSSADSPAVLHPARDAGLPDRLNSSPIFSSPAYPPSLHPPHFPDVSRAAQNRWRGEQLVRAPALVYSTRNRAGRLLSPYGVALLARCLERAPLLRLALHPRDARYPALMQHMQTLLEDLLRTHTPMTKLAFATHMRGRTKQHGFASAKSPAGKQAGASAISPTASTSTVNGIYQYGPQRPPSAQ